MVKLQKLPNGQLVLTLPKQLAQLKGWDKGTKLIFKDHSQNSFILEAISQDEIKEEEE
jgi:hypothetical protein